MHGATGDAGHRRRVGARGRRRGAGRWRSGRQRGLQLEERRDPRRRLRQRHRLQSRREGSRLCPHRRGWRLSLQSGGQDLDTDHRSPGTRVELLRHREPGRRSGRRQQGLPCRRHLHRLVGRQRRHPPLQGSRQQLGDDRHAGQDGRQRERPLDGRAAGHRSQPAQRSLLRIAQGRAVEERGLRLDVGERQELLRLRRRQGDRHPAGPLRRAPAAPRASRRRSSTPRWPTTTAAFTAAPTPA